MLQRVPQGLQDDALAAAHVVVAELQQAVKVLLPIGHVEQGIGGGGPGEIHLTSLELCGAAPDTCPGVGEGQGQDTEAQGQVRTKPEQGRQFYSRIDSQSSQWKQRGGFLKFKKQSLPRKKKFYRIPGCELSTLRWEWEDCGSQEAGNQGCEVLCFPPKADGILTSG